jgi:uncharacterized membrane protein YkvA (DUF1232 family)
MAVRSLLSWPGLLQTLLSQARLAARLMREPRVSMLTKAMLVGAGAYLISPLDFVPDVLPVLGQLDDLAVVLIALRTFIGLCPESAVAHHRTAIERRVPYSPMTASDVVIDAEWRREK